MTAPRFTPAEMRETAEALEYVLNECESDDKTIETATAMLIQAAEEQARWEALKVGVDEIHAHWTSFHSVCPAAVVSVQKLISSLEREP